MYDTILIVYKRSSYAEKFGRFLQTTVSLWMKADQATIRHWQGNRDTHGNQ
jgi:hypothetical protein